MAIRGYLLIWSCPRETVPTRERAEENDQKTEGDRSDGWEFEERLESARDSARPPSLGRDLPRVGQDRYFRPRFAFGGPRLV